MVTKNEMISASRRNIDHENYKKKFIKEMHAELHTHNACYPIRIQ